jgi:hypothetical protein
MSNDGKKARLLIKARFFPFPFSLFPLPIPHTLCTQRPMSRIAWFLPNAMVKSASAAQGIGGAAQPFAKRMKR